MNAKKYIASTSREALRMVRDELGPDAVILSNRKQGDSVEIVAVSGADFSGLVQNKPARKVPAQNLHETSHPSAVAAPPAIEVPAALLQEQQGILNEIKSMRSMMQEQLACL